MNHVLSSEGLRPARATESLMPRYFFHIDDDSFLDAEGTGLPDADRAHSEGIIIAGEILRDKGRASWKGGSWQMRVVDEAGKTVCELHFSAECRNS